MKHKQLIIKIGVLAFFLLLGFGIYFNSLHNEFQYDDYHHIVKNPYIQNTSNIPLFFTEPRTFSVFSGTARHYRPLIMSSYAINYYFGKLNPAGYHLVNLGFHAGSAFLVFLVIQLMMRGGESLSFPALAAGLFFLTTPFNSEVVNYVAARSTVMSAFFYLLSFYCWVKFREVAKLGRSEQVAGSRKNVGELGSSEQAASSSFKDLPATRYPLPTTYYIASLLTFILAILTKEIAITLPVMLWLYDLYFPKSSSSYSSKPQRRSVLNYRNFLPYMPFALIGIFSVFFLRRIFFGRSVTAPGESWVDNFHLVIKVKVLAKYFYHMIVPTQLSIEHLIQDNLNIYFSLSLIMVIGLILLAFRLWRSPDRGGKMVSFYIVWFFIVLFPIMAVSLHAPYQENRGYLSVAGLMGIVAVGLNKLTMKRVQRGGIQQVVIYILCGVLVVIYSAGTIARNVVWKSDVILWSDAMEKYPQSIIVRLQIGSYYARSGDFGRAATEYREVLNREPENLVALNRLGAIYLEKGDLNTAVILFEKALKIMPYSMYTSQNMARIYKERGQLNLANRHLLIVLGFSPHDLRIFEQLAENYMEMERIDDFHRMMTMALAEDPGNPGVRRALGLIYMYKKKWDAAQREFEVVLGLLPGDVRTRIDLTYVYSRMGILNMTEEQVKEALAMNPQDPEVLQTMGNLYFKKGRIEEALASYQTAMDINPNLFFSYNNLGLVYFQKGDMAKAAESFEADIRQNPESHGVRFNLARAYEMQGRKDLARKELQKVLTATSKVDTNKEIHQAAQKRLASLK
ncbi:MAG: hypothetical protein A2132_02675 [Nitrospirae bacterium RBG_16_43_11]|nr:MAG: hypothetical protein A2132_02675 [Nitrospirae bacterium RBG_16_43_11]